MVRRIESESIAWIDGYFSAISRQALVEGASSISAMLCELEEDDLIGSLKTLQDSESIEGLVLAEIEFFGIETLVDGVREFERFIAEFIDNSLLNQLPEHSRGNTAKLMTQDVMEEVFGLCPDIESRVVLYSDCRIGNQSGRYFIIQASVGYLILIYSKFG
ncbi:hypothetical protein [Pseudomonas sp. BN515]|uniref:hypothetical protein n=1 Tax=Pseudomonas sp. BN515 TaxID=2567892 RepID=UPI002457BD9E|nr:hypothetical protein [Pseudomonas sp. BN515]MDH4871361.1 hypothetical protein [Pseudomonas sp. BN515]